MTWNNHNNGPGERCPHFGTAITPHKDRCPAGCASSVPAEEE